MFDLTEIEKNLLLLDDNAAISETFLTFLRTSYSSEVVSTIGDAMISLREKEFGAIICGSSIVKREGRRLLAQMRSAAPHTPVILVGEKMSTDETVEVFRAGAFDYLFLPLEKDAVEQSVRRAIEEFEARHLKDRYQLHLESLAAERATAIDKALDMVESSYRITLKALVQALETRDFETHGHSERVVTFSLRLGFELGLEKEALRDLELGALLHDIGKIGVPDAILRKPAALNEEEWKKMRLHPLHGQKILRSIKFLDGAAKVVGQHHERWDGDGYPHRLRGEEIDVGARIFAVVDAFDAMISDRVYRKGRPFADAVKELERCAGTQFDPLIVDAFKAIPKEDWEVLRERSLMEKQEVSSFQAVVAELVYSKNQFEMVH